MTVSTGTHQSIMTTTYRAILLFITVSAISQALPDYKYWPESHRDQSRDVLQAEKICPVSDARIVCLSAQFVEGEDVNHVHVCPQNGISGHSGSTRSSA